LKKAGVSYAVMQEERCHAEVGRRLGEEYLYQTVQAENVEALNRYTFKKVITHCPHCFNTIKNEFPQFGGTYQVLHHAQVIDELIQAGRIKPIKPLSATVAFHDSCYLGRYNGIMDAPRRVAAAVPGLRVVDPPRARERGLCCGGGGGHMWMEVKAEKRVNIIRTEELLETGASVVATACPFCLAMVDLGRKVKEAEERLAVKDVSELVAESLE
jgi:Fe-S oxidoreductase